MPTLIDGFNLFYRWEHTRSYFRRSSDLEATLPRALSALKRALGRSAGQVRVVLDGGTSAGNAFLGGLKVEFAGAGRKADDVILARVRRADKPRQILVVTTDRELGGNCRALGSRIESVERFLRQHPLPVVCANVTEEEKPSPPTGAELERWLEIFGDGSDIDAEDEPHP
ncbi:MAG: NYN domain-containing protein [Planctomycetota bacterium]|jgi:predicted RNA-binding protein with PIN domain